MMKVAQIVLEKNENKHTKIPQILKKKSITEYVYMPEWNPLLLAIFYN